MNQLLFVFVIVVTAFGETACSKMNTSKQLSNEINEEQFMMKFSKGLELIYSGFMKQKLQSNGSITEGINPHCKKHVVKVISDFGNEIYAISSK